MASLVRRSLGALLVALSLTTQVHDVCASDLPVHARNGRLWAMIQSQTQGLFTTSSPELWFTQRVDHFASDDTATYQQRFYETNTYWKAPDGPVILYIGGEGAMNNAPTGFVDTLAKQWGAKILALEHRFYGKSIPNNDLSTENYKHLTVQQALADLKYFKEQYEAANFETAGVNKWVAVGGSYPGALAAWFRVAYPNTTVASLSSSGVVLPVYEFTGFDEQVAQSAGTKCADALRKTTAAFEQAIQTGNGTQVKGLLGAHDLCDADFFYMLADAAAMAVQYGTKHIVCSAMVNAVDKKLSLPDEFAKFTIDMYGAEFGRGCFYDTTCLAEDKSRWADVRSWRWQKCSQLAYFQTAPHSTKSLRASIVNLEYHLQQCHSVFGDAVDPKRGVAEIMKLYGGASPKAHNIFFANGGDDPWQRASVLKSLSEDEVAFLAKCDSCGHCGDLHAPNPNAPEPLKKQQQMIIQYLTKWLGLPPVSEQQVEMDTKEMTKTTVASVVAVEGKEGEQHQQQQQQQQQQQELYQTSPFVLVPVVLVCIALVAITKSDILRDSPRTGYVRLDTA